MANWWITFWYGAHLHLLVSGPVASGAYSVNPPFTHCSAQPGEVSVLRLATQTTAPSPPTSSEAGVSPRPLSPSHLCVLCLVTQSCPTLCNPMDYSPSGFSVHEDSPGKNTGVGCHALFQGIFSTQGSNPGLLHCRGILYQLIPQAANKRACMSRSRVLEASTKTHCSHINGLITKKSFLLRWCYQVIKQSGSRNRGSSRC